MGRPDLLELILTVYAVCAVIGGILYVGISWDFADTKAQRRRCAWMTLFFPVTALLVPTGFIVWLLIKLGVGVASLIQIATDEDDNDS